MSVFVGCVVVNVRGWAEVTETWRRDNNWFFETWSELLRLLPRNFYPNVSNWVAIALGVLRTWETLMCPNPAIQFKSALLILWIKRNIFPERFCGEVLQWVGRVHRVLESTIQKRPFNCIHIRIGIVSTRFTSRISK